MRGIDWDKVRRDRNARKPDYRDAFERNWEPAVSQSFPSVDTKSTARHYFTKENPKNAADIRAQLRGLGLSGRKLTETTNAILSGKVHIAWIELQAELRKLLENGFEAGPIEEGEEQAVARFYKRSQTGEIEEEKVFTLRRRRSAVPQGGRQTQAENSIRRNTL